MQKQNACMQNLEKNITEYNAKLVEIKVIEIQDDMKIYLPK